MESLCSSYPPPAPGHLVQSALRLCSTSRAVRLPSPSTAAPHVHHCDHKAQGTMNATGADAAIGTAVAPR